MLANQPGKDLLRRDTGGLHGYGLSFSLSPLFCHALLALQIFNGQHPGPLPFAIVVKPDAAPEVDQTFGARAEHQPQPVRPHIVAVELLRALADRPGFHAESVQHLSDLLQKVATTGNEPGTLVE